MIPPISKVRFRVSQTDRRDRAFLFAGVRETLLAFAETVLGTGVLEVVFDVVLGVVLDVVFDFVFPELLFGAVLRPAVDF